MTREQDFERQLAEWLGEGPSAAPTEVVERALEQTHGRRQWRGAQRLLVRPFERFGASVAGDRVARAGAFMTVLAGVLLASVIVFVPFAGGGPASTPTPTPVPTPTLDTEPPVAVVGTAKVEIIPETPTELVRLVDIETEDERIDGRARQELAVLVEAGGAYQLHGTMHLETPWGDWEGPVDIVHYPSGEEYEYASLTGSGAYEGSTYLHTVRQATAEAERTVEGAIWPDEPPAPPDPRLLP